MRQIPLSREPPKTILEWAGNRKGDTMVEPNIVLNASFVECRTADEEGPVSGLGFHEGMKGTYFKEEYKTETRSCVLTAWLLRTYLAYPGVDEL